MRQARQRGLRRQSGRMIGLLNGGMSRTDRFMMEALEERRLLSVSTVFDLAAELVGTPGGHLGWSVAAQDGLLLAGEPRATVVVDEGGENEKTFQQAGRAYLIDAATQQVVTELVQPNLASQNLFGQSVAFVGEWLLVGASGEGAGGVHVFDSSGTYSTTIESGFAGFRGDGFGEGLTSHGENGVLVWTRFAGGGVSDVHLFNVDGNGWHHAHTFEGDDYANGNFGEAIAASGNRVAIGAPLASGGPGAVVVHEFDGTQWNELPVIQGQFGDDQLGFGLVGTAVLFDGDDLLVGAPGHTTADGLFSGAVHRFVLSNGEYVYADTYSNPEPADDAMFGKGLALSGGLLLVGSTPAAYLLDLGLAEDQVLGKVVNPDVSDQFGFNVAIAGGRLVVGDPTAAGNNGVVYITEQVIGDEEPPPPGDGPGAELIGGTLHVTGAVEGSHIQIVQANSVEVIIDGVSFGTFEPTEWIIVRGGTGDNVIELDGSVAVPAMLIGGPGNDWFKGGGGPTIIVGGDGDDSIVGGKVRDLLIGGNGSDRIIGTAGDDILVSGATVYDDDVASLQAIMEVWNGSLSYTERVNAIRDTWFVPGSILHDGSTSVLTGSSGDNWFIIHGDYDKITGLKDQVFDDLRDWAELDEI